MFIAFMVCSEVYMLLSCILFKWSHTSNGRIMTKPVSQHLDDFFLPLYSHILVEAHVYNNQNHLDYI